MHKKTAEKLVAWLSLVVTAQFAAPAAVWSKSLGSMDLSSTVHSVRAGSLADFHSTVISAGGRSQLITPNTLLTPAEAQAVLQVLNSGHQSIILTSRDAAIGGTAMLNQPSGSYTRMVIPGGVTVLDHLNASNNALSVVGILNNGGSLFVSGSPNATTLTVNANSITNYASGLISSLANNVGLTLNAVGNIKNAGTISSGGDLTLNAGRSITNTGVLQAANSVNLSAGSGIFTNSGQVIAGAGDINVLNNALRGTLSFVGTGGTLSALQGNINFRDELYRGKGDLKLKGGDYLSKELNLYTGCGAVTADVGDVTGTVNMTAGDTHFNADTPTLKMGTWTVSDDPMVTNTGNIDITGVASLQGSDYVIIAGGNITATSATFQINTSGKATTNGGNVVLAAGALFKAGKVTGASLSGGDIDLSLVTTGVGGVGINTSSLLKANSNGGNVTMLAFSNAANTAGGHVSLASDIVTGSTGSGKAGTVTVIAQATSIGGVQTIDLKNINTSGGTGTGGGTITLYTGTPNATAAHPIPINASTGVITGSFLGGALQNGRIVALNLTTQGNAISATAGVPGSDAADAIQVGALNTSNASGSGGNVSLQQIGTTGHILTGISTGSINTAGTNLGKTGGSVLISSQNGPINISGTIGTSGSGGAAGGNVFIAGGTSADAGDIGIGGAITTTGATGGSVVLLSSGSIVSAAAINTSATTGAAGNVTAVSGAVSTVGATTTTITGGSTSGGDVSLSAGGIPLNTSSAGGAGGDVNLIAFKGTNKGHVSVANGTVVTSGTGANSGDVTIVAGASGPVPSPLGIQVQNVTTSGGTSGSGNVFLANAAAGTNVDINNSTGAVISGSFTGGATRDAAIQTGAISTNGGAVEIRAGSNEAGTDAIFVNGNIDTSSPSNGYGGDVTLLAASIGSGGESINVAGSVKTMGNGFNAALTAPFSGGNVIMSTPGGNVSANSVTTGDGTSANSGADGGFVVLDTELGNINVSGAVATNGAHAGNMQAIAGGNVSIGSIDTSQSQAGATSGTGGNVTLMSGVDSFIDTTTLQTTVLGPAGTAGDITVSGSINTASSATATNGSGSGGSVFLLAATDTPGTGGHVNVSGNISTKGAGAAGFSGNVFVVAQAASSVGTPTTIQLANIDTSTTNTAASGKNNVNGSGLVELVTCDPNIDNVNNFMIIDSGRGVVQVGRVLGGTFESGVISAGNITTTGGMVQVLGGANATAADAVSLGNINTSTDHGTGGVVVLMAGMQGSASNEDISVGSINTTGIVPTGGTTAQSGGNLYIVTPGNISVSGAITTGATGLPLVSAAGGDVLMLAGNGSHNGTISFTSIDTQSVYGGNVVLVSMGTAGNVLGNSITTNTSGFGSQVNGITPLAGAVTISSAAGVIMGPTSTTMSISTQGITGAFTFGHGGDVLLSTGSTSTTVLDASVNTSTSAGGGNENPGQVFAITLSGKTANLTTTQTKGGAAYGVAGLVQLSGSQSGLPTGSNQRINFVGKTDGVTPAAIVDAANVATSAFSPGGFSSVSDSGIVDFTMTAQTTNNLIVPVVAVPSGGGIALTSSTAIFSCSGSQNTQFFGTSINITDNFSSSGTQINGRASMFGSTGAITVSPSGVGQTFHMGGAISPSSFMLSVNGTITIHDPIVAQHVSLVGTGTGTITNSSTIYTQQLSINTTGALAGQSTTSLFNTISGVDPLLLDNIVASKIQLTNIGTIYLNGATVTGTSNALEIQAVAGAGNSGNIAVQGSITNDEGAIILIANGSIYTTGATDIQATGRDGTTGHQTGGNYVYIVAGANFTNVSSSEMDITGRSGLGGDVIMPGLNSLTVTTDRSASGGGISVVAFSGTNSGLLGGRIELPDTLNIVVTSPDGTSPAAAVGVTIVGEATGGPSEQTTVSIGDVSSGIGSINIAAASPDVSPIKLFKINPGTGTVASGTFFQGLAQTNSSVKTGDLSVLGTTNQKIQIISGGTLTTGNLVSIGTQGWSPQPCFGCANPSIFGFNTLNAFAGGNGGSMTISAKDDVTINGNVYSFGGGGGGGVGDAYVDPFSHNGGNGGVGGNGGSISITTLAGTIHVLGDVNSSGGGGGGGGGGYGGVGAGTNQNPFSSGGNGGAGGAGGSVTLSAAGASSDSTIIIDGSILAAPGGAGGKGGDGNAVGIAGGSGGAGGGSLGAAGGGGGAGVSNPSNTNPGVAGAGGGGLYGGAGGNVPVTNTTAGLGGYGGGGLLAGGVVGNFYGPGQANTCCSISGQPGDYGAGGNGATYGAFAAAIGGTLGRGGQGGVTVVGSNIPLAAAAAGTNGTDSRNSSANGGRISILSNTFTTPSEMFGGTFDIFSVNPGNITLTGEITVTGKGGTLNPGEQAFTAKVAQGDLIIDPNTKIKVRAGGILLNAVQTTSHITIGANADLFAAGGLPSNVIIAVGTAPLVNSVLVNGKTPANVVPVTIAPATALTSIFFIGTGTSASTPKNYVYALGKTPKVIFSTPTGSSKLITLGGNVQIGAQINAPLSALDLTNTANAQLVVNRQQTSFELGGKLTFSGTSNSIGSLTGGNVIIYPVSIDDDMSALAIPKGVTLTFANFSSSTPITVSPSFTSTSTDIQINGKMTFTNANTSLTINSALAPDFNISSTGSMSVSGNLILTNYGDINIAGPATASGTMQLINGLGSNGSINLSANVSGAKGLTLATDGLGAFTTTKGILSSPATVLIRTGTLNMSGGSISGGTVGLDTSDPTEVITVGGSSIVPGTLTITRANLLAIKGTTLQIGSLSHTAAINVISDLNVTTASQTAVPAGVGIHNLSFLGTGAGSDLNAGGQSIILGGKTLNVNVGGDVTIGTLTNGSKITIAAGGDITLTNGMQSPTATVSLLAGGTINGAPTLTIKALTLGIGAGEVASLTTNAKTLTLTSLGTLNVTDTAAVTIGQSSIDTLNLTDTLAKGKVTFSKPLTATASGDLTVSMTGLDGGIVIGANITADTVTLSANGKGTITQTNKTAVLTANSVSLNSGIGNIGTAIAPISMVAPTVSFATGGQAFVSDNAISVVANANNTPIVTLSGSGDIVLNHGASPMTLNKVFSGASYTVNSAGSLTLLGLTTNGLSSSNVGDATITTSSGAINVNGNIKVTGGSILIQDTDLAAGIITFKTGAQVTTLVTSSKAANGTITVAVDSAINPGAALISSPTILVTTTGGGASVSSGTTPSSIVAPVSGVAKLTALGTAIILDAANATTKIVLNSNVLIKADPPVAGVAASTSQLLSSTPRTQHALVVQPMVMDNGSAPVQTQAGATVPTYAGTVYSEATRVLTHPASSTPGALGNHLVQTMNQSSAPSMSAPAASDEQECIVDSSEDTEAEIIVSEPLHAVGF